MVLRCATDSREMRSRSARHSRVSGMGVERSRSPRACLMSSTGIDLVLADDIAAIVAAASETEVGQVQAQARALPLAVMLRRSRRCIGPDAVACRSLFRCRCQRHGRSWANSNEGYRRRRHAMREPIHYRPCIAEAESRNGASAAVAAPASPSPMR